MGSERLVAAAAEVAPCAATLTAADASFLGPSMFNKDFGLLQFLADCGAPQTPNIKLMFGSFLGSAHDWQCPDRDERNLAQNLNARKGVLALNPEVRLQGCGRRSTTSRTQTTTRRAWNPLSRGACLEPWLRFQ